MIPAAFRTDDPRVLQKTRPTRLRVTLEDGWRVIGVASMSAMRNARVNAGLGVTLGLAATLIVLLGSARNFGTSSRYFHPTPLASGKMHALPIQPCNATRDASSSLADDEAEAIAPEEQPG